jgi:hypothetical protein
MAVLALLVPGDERVDGRPGERQPLLQVRLSVVVDANPNADDVGLEASHVPLVRPARVEADRERLGEIKKSPSATLRVER